MWKVGAGRVLILVNHIFNAVQNPNIQISICQCLYKPVNVFDLVAWNNNCLFTTRHRERSALFKFVRRLLELVIDLKFHFGIRVDAGSLTKKVLVLHVNDIIGHKAVAQTFGVISCKNTVGVDFKASKPNQSEKKCWRGI